MKKRGFDTSGNRKERLRHERKSKIKVLTPEEIEKRGFDISGNDKQRVLHQRKQKIEALTQAEMKRKALTPEEIEKRSFDINGNEKERVPHRISPDSPGAHKNARARFGAVWRQLRKWSTSGCVFLGFRPYSSGSRRTAPEHTRTHVRDLDQFCDSYANGALRGA